MEPIAIRPDTILLLDSTVYIDGAKHEGLPSDIETLTKRNAVRHAKTCIAELAFGDGRRDPAHPKTRHNQAVIARMLATIPETAIVDTTPAGWAKAGALAGWLARTQGFAGDRRGALFNDALLFVTAQELGMTLLSGNIRDMDMLLQIGGPADVLLYALD